MSSKRIQYEELLAEYSGAASAIALLKQYRPYLELLPSMRRPLESVIPLPLPVVRLRSPVSAQERSHRENSELLCLPCDITILMCDPEWKIKTGVEIFLFIHRPNEDFSDLLGRWRRTQVNLGRGYAWEMPLKYRHILSEGADKLYPLFLLFEDTPERIQRGLKGAFLPFVVHAPSTHYDEPAMPSPADSCLWMDDRETPLT